MRALGTFNSLIAFFLVIFVYHSAAFAGPGRTTYQAKIIKPDGFPLEASSVNFKFTILDPNGSCILYSEIYSGINMNSSGGLVSFSLGAGLKTFPLNATTFEQVFSNVTPSLACAAGGFASYSPLSTDTRKVIVQFNDGNGWQTLPAMNINAVPYAMFANESQRLQGLGASDFVQVSTLASCGVSEALRFDGAGFSCVTVGAVTSSSSSGGVSYTVVSPLALSGTQISLAQNGATSGQVLRWTGSQWAPATIVVTSNDISTALGYAPTSSGSYTTVVSSVTTLASSFATLANQISNFGSLAYANSIDLSSASATGIISEARLMNISGMVSGAQYTKVTVDGKGRVISGSQISATEINSTLAVPSCSENQYLSFNGTTYSCGTDAGASGTITSVTTTGALSSTTGTNPVLSLNYNSDFTLLSSALSLVATGVVPGTYVKMTVDSKGRVVSSSALTAADVTSALGYVPVSVVSYTATVNSVSTLSASYSAVASQFAGLGDLAYADSLDLGSASATGIISETRLRNVSNVVSGAQYSKVTVDGKGRVISGSQITAAEINSALSVPTCAVNQYLSFNGTNYSCVADVSSSTAVSSQWISSGPAIGYTSGSVGVGRLDPSSKLEIYNDMNAASATFLVNNPNAGVSATSKVRVRSGNIDFDIFSRNATHALGRASVLNTDSATPLIFSNLETERMRLTSSGNLGIGTSSPAVALDVSGTLRVSQICDRDGNNCQTISSGWNLGSSSGPTSTSGSAMFGDVETKNQDTIYQATQDGFVNAWYVPAASENTRFEAFTDMNSTPTTKVAEEFANAGGHGRSMTFWVKRNHYWRVVRSAGTATTATVTFMPVFGGVSSGSVSMIDFNSVSTTGTLSVARLPAFSGGDVTSVSGASILTLTNSGVVSGSYTRVTVDTKGRVVSGSNLTATDISTALGYIPTSSTTSSSSTAWVTLPLADTNPFDPKCDYILNGQRVAYIATGSILAVTNGVATPTTASWYLVYSGSKGTTYSAQDNYSNNSYGGGSATSSILYRCGSGGSQFTNVPLGINYSFGNLGLDVVSPTARLHIEAGTTTLAPLKFSTGSFLTTPQLGAVEFDGNELYLTVSGSVRKSFAFDNDSRITSAVQTFNNLSDLTSAAIARTNLGLGLLSTLNFVDLGSGYASGTLAAARLPAFTGDMTTLTGSTTTTVARLRGIAVSSTLPTTGQILTYNGSTWAASNPAISSQWVTTGTTINYLSGNVGIGTNNPTRMLHIAGNATSPIPGVAIEHTGSNGRNYGLLTTGAGNNQGDGKFLFYDLTSSTTRMAIDSFGRVGIGTASPTTVLTVSGTIRSISGGFQFPDGSVQTTAMTAGVSGAAANGAFAFVNFDGSTCSPNCTIISSSNIASVVRNSTGHYTVTMTNGAGSANYAIVTGGSQLGTTATNDRFASAWPSSGTQFQIMFSAWVNGNAPIDAKVISAVVFSGNSIPEQSQWTTAASNIYFNSGNVGIGTSTPQATLEVSGTIRLAKNSAQPSVCSATNDGTMAMTSGYVTCVCKSGVGWVQTSDGATTCNWTSSGGSGLGVAQTWQNVSASRAFATTYTNSTSKPIFVSISTYQPTSAGGNVFHSINGVEQSHLGVGINNGKTVTFIVPPGGTYSARTDSTYTISSWFELR